MLYKFLQILLSLNKALAEEKSLPPVTDYAAKLDSPLWLSCGCQRCGLRSGDCSLCLFRYPLSEKIRK